MKKQADDPLIAAERLAGNTALRKNPQVQAKSRWAKRISIFAVVGIIVTVGWAANAILK